MPEASAVTVAIEVPVRVTVAPLPADEGLIAPESVQVCWDDAVVNVAAGRFVAGEVVLLFAASADVTR